MRFTYYYLFIIFLIGCQSEKVDNEILNGQYIEKNKDGVVKVVGNFKNDIRDGMFIYFDNRGKLNAQEDYKMDKLHGEQITIHTTGKVKSKISYENGVKNGNYSKFYKNNIWYVHR